MRVPLVLSVLSVLVVLDVCLLAARAPAETLVPSSDDTRIETDVSLVPGTILLPDGNGNGVLHVVSDGVTVDLTGATLAGAGSGVDADALAGWGISIEGRRNVTIRGGAIRGFKVGIRAKDCVGLRIEDVDVSDNYRQRLGSTPAREDVRDWLRPHVNDDLEWETRYGAGISLTDCPGARVTGCRARRGQNGLLLTRCDRAIVQRNDLSFLSGWGLALWRSSRCVILRNRFDWCVRGYSHGVYDRGQDSTGILVFEQCHDNVFAFNSATHGGDGFFLYAGHETTQKSGEGGCNGNLLFRNDFSHAVANGIEATFSERNLFLENRLDDCRYGVWAGYSRETVIRGNLVRGSTLAGVAIEHGHDNVVEGNVIEGGGVGVLLWWDEDREFLDGPFGEAQDTSSSRTTIRGNRLSDNGLAVHLDRTTATRVVDNEILGGKAALRLRGDCAGLVLERNVIHVEARPNLLNETGTTVAVGPNLWLSPAGAEGAVEVAPDDVARPRPARWRPLPAGFPFLPAGAPRGRARILVDDWGPYDFVAPRLWPSRVEGGADATLNLLGPDVPYRVIESTGGLRVSPRQGRTPAILRVTAPGDGPSLIEGRIVVEVDGARVEAEVALLRATWTVRWFAWETDPREDATAFAKLLEGTPLAERTLPSLDLRPGGGRPDEAVPPDRFATVAETTLTLPTGVYELVTMSDDGVRVKVDGKTVLENWTWHGPTEDRVRLRLEEGAHRIRVEHFELDGWSMLSLRLRR